MAARAVGQAKAHCPDDVPWWRVVHADGRMKGTPGADEQRARLAEEGVPLTPDGRVDWTRAGAPWSPDPIRAQSRVAPSGQITRTGTPRSRA
jgi:hypothetical protein